jgi:hypothetical protein
LVEEAYSLAVREWLQARDDAMRRVLALVSSPELVATGDDLAGCLDELEVGISSGNKEGWLDVHKQVANRLLEPFMWHTVIVSATDWDNFWNLRCHPDAQPEIRRVADLMRCAVDASEPMRLGDDDWHLPLINDADRAEISSIDSLIRISAGRCARVSYLTHAGIRDHIADIGLYERLANGGHMSPLEHPARPLSSAELRENEWCGNFRGWKQFRKSIPWESNPLGDGPTHGDIVADEGGLELRTSAVIA